jgi:hypothetical protein
MIPSERLKEITLSTEVIRKNRICFHFGSLRLSNILRRFCLEYSKIQASSDSSLSQILSSGQSFSWFVPISGCQNAIVSKTGQEGA